VRFFTAGESHGPGLSVIIEGVPAGLQLQAEDIDLWLARRQGGYGRGARMQIEKDKVEILAGLRDGITLGSPLAFYLPNREWDNWKEIMSPHPGAKAERVVTRPRPGHADLPGAIKYRHRDIRNVLERASARETAARVVAGAVAWRLLKELGVEVLAHVLQIGPVAVARELSLEEIRRAWESPVYCACPVKSQDMVEAIQQAKEKGDTLGGVVEVRVSGLVPGLGSYVHWDRRLDGRLAQAVMSVPAVKGVEVGEGFKLAALMGSQAHDAIYYKKGRGFHRATNRAGGLEGGVTNGEELVVRAALKPIPTLRQPLPTVDLFTKEPVEATVERSDVCAVPAGAVVVALMVAWVLAQAYLEKLGGDHMEEIGERLQAYRDYLASL